jgi:hypothetical protein
MKNYQKVNNIVGWAVFLIAAMVYIMTIEPTASFWDCGEFIATAYKLEVGHPPGAPLFQMMARFMILFAGGDVTKVPVMVNIMSALASAFAILFLFWSITALAKKLVAPKGGATTAQLIAIMGSGAVGALAYTFSDSFWFSAVEGEVYASSSFFTAIVFWAILKWETVAEEKHASRWIILIAYLMGLSIGVHLLNLLCIPAICFVYYFKKYKPTTKGFIITSILSLVILGTVQAGIIPGIVSTMAKFDLFFVNTLGMPFNSGVIVFFTLLIGSIVGGLIYTKKKQKPIWNTVILCFAFILIGYSSFALIVVRSKANPPMDENNPENVFTLLSYLNREQYGDRPLLQGQYYTAKYIDQEQGDMTYNKGKDKYIETGRKIIPIYDPKESTIFPRMYSNQASHISAYKQWADVVGDKKPTFGQNLKFFFSYQVNYMYLRYFMWNFVGRQNDIQGSDGNIKEGNWISGIKPLDAIRLGNQDDLPESMTNNKGMNKFYFLPLIIGIIGLFYQLKRSKEDTFVVFLLFLLTGLAIVIYLNQTPYQPRERDYAYAGSFYAFAIWIGLGVLGIIEFLQKKLDAKTSGIIATVVCLLGAPVIMAKDGWNDHDRSGRFTARDFAHDYLNSCAPNAILFTNGDNDTFPLWYAQEVEGIRTDVRVCNLSLLNTDWYIDQMKRKAYDSEPIPYTLGADKFFGDTRNYIPFYDQKMAEPVNLKDLIEFIGSDDPQAKLPTQGGEALNYFPTKNFRLSVDSAAVLANGTVSKDMAKRIVKSIDWTVDKNFLMKADIAILDLLAANNWKRPVYFAITVGSESYLNLEDYFQLEGLAYRLVPIKNERAMDGQTGRVLNNVMYDNLMNKFKWGGLNNPKVYLDENNLRMTMNFRNNFARLAESLLSEGKKDSAFAALNKCLEVMPDKTVPFNVFTLRIAEMYYRIALENNSGDSLTAIKDTELTSRSKKAIETGNALVKRLADIYSNDLQYYYSLNGKYLHTLDRDLQQAMAVMQELVRLSKEAKQTALTKELESRFATLQAKYNQSGRGN